MAHPLRRFNNGNLNILAEDSFLGEAVAVFNQTPRHEGARFMSGIAAYLLNLAIRWRQNCDWLHYLLGKSALVFTEMDACSITDPV